MFEILQSSYTKVNLKLSICFRNKYPLFLSKSDFLKTYIHELTRNLTPLAKRRFRNSLNTRRFIEHRSVDRFTIQFKKRELHSQEQ